MTGPDRWPGPPDDYVSECPDCEGAGLAGDGASRCPTCDGTGVVIRDDDEFWGVADFAYERAVDA